MADECRGAGVGGMFLAFVMGAAIGGGIALLTAPRSGRETREKVRDMAEDVRDKVRDLTDEAETRIKKVIDEGKELLTEKQDLIKSAIEAGKEAIEAEKQKHQKTV